MIGYRTPGPWYYEYGSVYADKVLSREPGATVRVRIGGADRDDPHTWGVERDANTRLMAAAPELLDALQQLAPFLETDKSNDWTAELVTIRAAIARAVGS